MVSRGRGSVALFYVGLASLFLTACATIGDAVKKDPAAPANGQYADTIYLGENIITMDANTEGDSAVAISNDEIIAVGNRSDVLRYRSEKTAIVELGEKALLPGFIDAHGHFTGQATLSSTANLSSPPVGEVRNIEDLKRVLITHIRKNKIPAGEWVIGYGYDDSLISDQRHPTRADLDAVSSVHPIHLLHVSGHLGATNSLALKIAKIGPETPNPEGGVFRRMTDGKTPNGVLEERAQYILQKYWPTPTAAEALVGIETAQKLYAGYGITTVQDGAASMPAIDLLRTADSQGKLSLDIVSYLHLAKPKQMLPPSETFGSYGSRHKLGGVKLVLDGSPQGKTAYLSEPFHVVPSGQKANYNGYANYPVDKINQMVDKVLDHKVPLIAHANGDAAAELLIDAVEQAHAENRKGTGRTVMIHAQTVRDDQLDRIARLGMVPSFFSSHVFFWGDWHRDSVLGPLRGARISPTRSALDRNIPFTIHNDGPVVPPDMIRLLWATSHRATRSGKILGAEQRVSIRDAIKAITINAAYQYFEEDRKGSISVGKQADLVILSENPLTLQPAELLRLKVMETISRGQSVYSRQ